MLGSNNSKELLKSSYSLSTRVKAIAEWNHNIFNAPRIYGSFTNADPSDQIKSLTDISTNAVKDENNLNMTLRDFGRSGTIFNDYSLSYNLNQLNYQYVNNNGFSFYATNNTYYRISFYAKTSSSTVDKLFIHFTEYNGVNEIADSGHSNAVSVDNVDWSFHEISISASSPNVESIRVNFSSELIIADYQVSDITVVELTSSEWQGDERFKVKETFAGFRPGDEIVENQLNQKTSGIIYQRGQSISTQSFPGMDTLNYFATENSGGVYAIYDNSIQTNKIIIKLLNGAELNTIYGNHIGTNYSVFIYNASTNTWNEITGSSIGNIDENGSLSLYWNGTSWTKTKTVAEISTDGKSLIGTTQIDGIALKVSSINSSIQDNTIRFLEVSPRLSVNLSDYVVNFNASKELDSHDVPLPVGVSTANNASITLENLPRLDSGQSYFNIFSDQSTTSPFSTILRRDVKVQIKFDLYNNLGSLVESELPLFVGYVDSWNINDSSAELNLFDYGKYLQNKRSRDLLLLPTPTSDNTIKNILTQVFEQNGFSDYIISDSLTNYHINSYYIDKQKTIWDSIQELLFPYQYMGYFDSKGFFTIKSYNDFISTTPAFKFTDVAKDGYLSNINKLSINKKEKPSEIKIRYNTVSTKISADMTDQSVKDAQALLKTSPDKVWEVQAERSLGYTKLAKDLTATAKELFLDTSKWGGAGVQEWSDFSGYLSLDDEIMKYDGIEVIYSITGGQSETRVVKSKKEYQKLQNDIFEAQKQTGEKTLTLTRTGKLVNLERGVLNTKAKPHIAKAGTPIYSAPGETDIADMYIYKKIKKSSSLEAVTGTPAIAKSDYHGANKDTVIRLESISGNDMTMLGYKKDSTSFDIYEFEFAYPEDKVIQNKSKKGKLDGHNPLNENDYMGVFLGVDPTNGHGIFIEFPLKGNKVHKKTSVYLNKNTTASATAPKNSMDLYKSSTKTKTQKVSTKKSKKSKKTKSKKAKSKKIQYVERKFNDDFVKIRVETKGKKITKILVNGKKYSFKKGVTKKAWSGDTNINRDGGLMGMYVGSKTHINIKSIKAWDSKTLTVDVKPLIAASAPPVDYTLGTVVRGAELFNVEFTNGPAYGHKIIKPAGNYTVTNSAQKEMALPVGESSVSVINEEFSPYRAKFFIKNTDDMHIPIYSNKDMLGLRISANILVKSEELEYVEKIQDNTQTSNIIELTSDWIQSESNARGIAAAINKFVKLSMDTYQIEVFGNPLLEIGDVVNLYYYQSGMTKDSKYIIVGVEESFDGGFETSLILRRITS